MQLLRILTLTLVSSNCMHCALLRTSVAPIMAMEASELLLKMFHVEQQEPPVLRPSRSSWG